MKRETERGDKMERGTEKGDKMEREETIAVVYHPFLFYSESKLSPSYETERGGSMERETERVTGLKGVRQEWLNIKGRQKVVECVEGCGGRQTARVDQVYRETEWGNGVSTETDMVEWV